MHARRSANLDPATVSQLTVGYESEVTDYVTESQSADQPDAGSCTYDELIRWAESLDSHAPQLSQSVVTSSTSDVKTDKLGGKNSSESVDAKNSPEVSSPKNRTQVTSSNNSSVSPVKQVTGRDSDTVSQGRYDLCLDSTESQSVNESKLLTEPLSADLSESVIGDTDECLLLSKSLSDSVLPNTEIQSVAESQSDMSQSDRDAVSGDRDAVCASKLLSGVKVAKVQFCLTPMGWRRPVGRMFDPVRLEL